MTETFKITSNTVLYFYRVILVHQTEPDYENRFLPDTVIYTVEIFNAADNLFLARLDSLGCLPVTNGKDYPYLFGKDTTKTKFSIDLSSFSSVADSCYLKFKVQNHGPGSPTFNVVDAELMEQFSKVFYLTNDYPKGHVPDKTTKIK